MKRLTTADFHSLAKERSIAWFETPFPKSREKAEWSCPEGADHKWKATYGSIKQGGGCPYCDSKRSSSENCLASLNPKLAAQWHESLNGDLTPTDVTVGSGKKVWWQCSKGHEWQAVVYGRNKGSGCPYCAGLYVTKENCLATKNPQLAKDWHPTRNENCTPENVMPGISRKVWWICMKGHEWEAAVNNRSQGQGCPFCAGKQVNEENCLGNLNPGLAKEWHPTKNNHLTPFDVTSSSGKKVWWVCEKGHEWEAVIGNRNSGSGCAMCSGRVASKENCLVTQFPEIADQWHPVKNKPLKPTEVTYGSNRKVWWMCSKGHEWEQRVKKRTQGRGCSECFKINRKERNPNTVNRG
jgi:hypothetical protein